ncbi:F-box domain-containing protein [Mycena chlorophos]|uniref:F-box domain-containing protein n=1 Tax=Mycena chlorophos TaxID=658473 RepID=A0A8H6TLP2_MYCCL|nr:F-box domain-containing protein [Mycena chlorophos]
MQVDGLLSLPNELLLDIFAYFDDPYPLFPLSSLCRRLHFIALPLYLERTGVYEALSPALCNISIRAEQTGVLAALQTALFLGKAHNLTCTFTHPQSRFSDIARYRRLVSILDGVRVATLVFDPSTFDEYSEGLRWRYGLDVVHALNTVLEKSCTELTFGTPNAVPGSRVSRRHRINGNVRSVKQPQSSASLSPGALQKRLLTALHLHSEIPFCPQLRTWTTAVLHSFPLSTLSIWMPNAETELLGTIFSEIELPTLRHLTVRQTRLKPASLHFFLGRHPQLTHLHLEKLFVPSPQERLPPTALQSLVSLTAEPIHTAYLLHVLDPLPSSFASIRLLGHLTTVDVQAADAALHHVRSRIAQLARITLTLPVPDMHGLPTAAPDTGLCLEETESALYFVSHLEFSFGDCTTPIPLFKLLDYVAKWSAAFPLLRVVELAQLGNQDKYSEDDVVQGLRKCLEVETLVLNGRICAT